MSYTGKAIDLSKYEKYGKKVELSKVEVELSSVKEIQSILDQLEKDIASREKEETVLNDKEQEFRSAQRVFKTDVLGTFKDIDFLEGKAKEFAQKAEQLGLGTQPIVKGTLDYAKKLRAKMKNLMDSAKRIK